MARILISGAGIGGLALAQALRRSGQDVTVFERDPTPTTRHQGYRLHIDPNGNAALRECLPAHVLDRVRDTAGINGDLVATYTAQLEPVARQIFPELPADEITHVDRDAFRQALLTDLADHVHFGRMVTGFRITAGGRARIEFADGRQDEGDLLVGADGVGSPIRRRLLPDALQRDLGLRCLYGRIPLDASIDPLVPPDFDRGFCWIADRHGHGAGFAPVRFRSPQAGRSDYLMVTLVAPPERLGVPDDELFSRSPEELGKLVATATAAWHPVLRELVAHADVSSFFPIILRASERVEAWTPGPVTLLGDAIHTMPPAGGVGANTALQDAATLAAELLAAGSGQAAFLAAITAYERTMLARGFDTVDRSLGMLGQMFTPVH